MANRRSRWVLAAAALAMLVGSVAGDVAAKKSKKIFKPTVNGKRLRPTPRSVELAAGGGTIGFLATGSKVAKGLSGTSKIVIVSCVNDLSIQAFPFTSTDCLAGYTETRARPLETKIWTHLQTGATEVTIGEYTPGVFISGRFRSVVPAGPSNPDLPPVTLEGEFRGPVTLGDPSR